MGKLRRFLFDISEYLCCCFSATEVHVPLYDEQEEHEREDKPFVLSSPNKNIPKKRGPSSVASYSSADSSYASPSDRQYTIGVTQMSDKQFVELLQRLKEMIHDDERVEYLMNVMMENKGKYGLSCEQVDSLLKEISFSTMKQECLENLLPYITNLSNLKQQEKHILSQVEFHSDKRALKEKVDAQIKMRRA
jgi:hypothetical protein